MRRLLPLMLILPAANCATAPSVSDSAVIDGLRPYVDRAALDCGAGTADDCVLSVRDLIAAYDRAAGLR